MAKGGRKGGTSEKEVEEASERMRKYPEHLRSASTSDEWTEFLVDIGVKPEIVESSSGGDFWEKVRDKTTEKSTGFTSRELVEANVTAESKVYIDDRGKFTAEKTERPVVSFRDNMTGRFVKRTAVENI